MKIGVVQIRPDAGDIEKNITRHLAHLERAATLGVEIAIFPELSLTGYEPGLAKELAIDADETRLDVFQALSDANRMTIGIGAPTRSEAGLHISLILFRPQQERRVYSKTYLHPDEAPFFESGAGSPSFILNGLNVAFAICYELSVAEHTADALESGADIFIASSAKAPAGVAQAHERLAEIARAHAIPVLMANSVGSQDDFTAAGGSAAWNCKGESAGTLGDDAEGLLIFDTESQTADGKALKSGHPAVQG